MLEKKQYILESLIRKNNKIYGFAVYPISGDSKFRTYRFVHKTHTANYFLLKNITLFLMINFKKKYVSEINISKIKNDGEIVFSKMSKVLENVFYNLPDYKEHPDDFH